MSLEFLTADCINRKDLTLLADYLEQLPEGYEQFEMSHFTSTYDDLEEFDTSSGFICGTSGCAVGHAPFVAGVSKPLPDEGWIGYSERIAFGDAALYCWEEVIWEFMFGSFWSEIDNTPQGAARRIKAVLVGPEKCFNFMDEEQCPINDIPKYRSENYQQLLRDLGV